MGTTATDPETLDRRAGWVAAADRMARPVLDAAALGRLRATLPVEQHPEAFARSEVTHLEAVGRLLCGLAPWFECEAVLPDDEARARADLHDLAVATVASIVDPEADDAANFTRHHQPLVDAAFLGLALLRAPTMLGSPTEPTRTRLRQALESTRSIQAFFSNWLLFAAIVELAIEQLGGVADEARIDYAVRQHEQWYVGDGRYADGPEYRDDYYDSIVIHPLLLAIADRRPGLDWWVGDGYRRELLTRAQRRSVVLERTIGPDGSFPPIGRSLAYRGGVFHLLADLAARTALPDALEPGVVRAALGAVTTRTLDPEGTYDDHGFLRIGVAGHQPEIGEEYISTGSLYLASAVFLPLGLDPDDAFWADPPRPWSARRVWQGGTSQPDVALGGRSRL